jgi:hypothetical protein
MSVIIVLPEGLIMDKKRITILGLISSLVMVCFMLSLICGCCCCKKEDEKLFSDSARPEWSYDQPFYVRSADADKPLQKFDRNPVEIYTQQRLLQIPRPEVGDAKKAPRIAIWMTKDNGIHWDRIGYFGLEQSIFSFEVEGDGDYGIRFIGPGIPPAKCKPPKPHMNFHVDSVPPSVAVFVQPDQECYYPGQTITVEWCATDPNLKPSSVEIGICIGSQNDKMSKWKKLESNYPMNGNLDLVIPDDAIDKTISIRVTAWDKAQNLGHGYSCPLSIVFEPEAACTTTQPACSQPANMVETAHGPQVLTTMPQTYPSMEK